MSGQIEQINAVIRDAKLSISDHGVLTVWLELEYGNSLCQGFGGYSLYLPKSFTHHSGQANYAGHFIWRCMEVAGVEKWDNIVGRSVRVRKEWGKVHAVGHIIEEDWFEPDKDFEAMKGEQ